jgi:hypothetical protein
MAPQNHADHQIATEFNPARPSHNAATATAFAPVTIFALKLLIPFAPTGVIKPLIRPNRCHFSRNWKEGINVEACDRGRSRLGDSSRLKNLQAFWKGATFWRLP